MSYKNSNKYSNHQYDNRIGSYNKDVFDSTRCFPIIINDEVHGYIDESDNAVIINPEIVDNAQGSALHIYGSERREVYDYLVNTLNNQTVAKIPFKTFLPKFDLWQLMTLIFEVNNSIYGYSAPNNDRITIEWINFFKQTPIISYLYKVQQENLDEITETKLIEIGQDLLTIFQTVHILKTSPTYIYARDFVNSLKKRQSRNIQNGKHYD